MENIIVQTKDGTNENCTVYNVHDFPYNKIRCKLVYKRSKKHPRYYCNIPAAFDIETTTLQKLNLSKMDGSMKGYAFMYHWQFCIDKLVCFGRTWEEFQLFLKTLKKAMNLGGTHILPIYVHNLAYEFQFMKDFFPFEEVFAREKHKVMKASIDAYEFRCSYYLSNMSLVKFCENSKNVRFYKLVDTYDYTKIRTPITQLTENEKAYCYCDVRGLCECIQSLLEEDTLATIPLTNTGYVRREYRKAMNTKTNKNNFRKIALLPHQYELCKKAFRGGNTHASRYYTNRIVSNVTSYDISSSYPAAIMLDYYPMSKFVDVTIDTQEKLDYYCNNFCVVMTVSFYNIQVKPNNPMPYIDIAHCEKRSKIENDNGRILSADFIQLSCTEIDLEIIRNTYDYDGLQIDEAMYAERGILPRELRRTCMEFFTKKSLLKGNPEKEYEYMKAKNRLNSTYGMMVTDLVHEEIIYSGHEWSKIQPDLTESLLQYYSNKNSFLHYQWGIYVTAHARKRLQYMIDKVGMDIIYIDTDSIKFVNSLHNAEFEETNNQILELIKKADIPPIIQLENGKTYTMGTWDHDADYIYFKTLGAKKYCYNDAKDGSFHTTVSGMSKKLGAENIKCCSNFQIGRQMEHIGRTTSWYNDDHVHEITVAGDTFTTGSNIGILDTTYTLGVTHEYWQVFNIAQAENSYILNKNFQ